MKSHFLYASTAAAILLIFVLNFCQPVACGADSFGVTDLRISSDTRATNGSPPTARENVCDSVTAFADINKLMRPDSLDGWTYGHLPPGARQPAGWTITAGRLSGTARSTPLLSGFTAGDCELRFNWSVSSDGAWKIFMPKVPSGPDLQIILFEGTDCGRLSYGDKTLSAGVRIEPKVVRGEMHTSVISRQGENLSLMVDGKKIFETDIPVGRYGLGLAVVRGSGALADLRGAEPLGQSMMEDDSLAYWKDADKKGWRRENGELVLRPGRSQFLQSKKEYSNFVLSFQYKMQKRGNSGMAIRVPPRGWPSADGMELQLYDRPYEPIDHHSQMSIYGNVVPLARADKSGEWNDVVIKADGWMISAWVNGELVQQYNTLHHPELKQRFLKGWIGPQDHRAWIRFRDVRILEAPDGTGLDVWNEPQEPTAATAMVDRLMNPESVSKPDGITSGVVVKRIETGKRNHSDNQKHLIADLRGPGAVVRVAYSGQKGRLCFYFDGEFDPRIDCPPSELWQYVPPLNEDRSPVLTYLPYKKSLKILLRDADNADFVIDYVNFPNDMPIETFSKPRSSIPRGWLEPLLYRQYMISWGIYRERDPQLRVVSERKPIYAGQTVELAHIDGAGLVRWVRLLASHDELQINDLWISATIDGESQPAVSAPARFWFPGLADDSENYKNYLMVHRRGPTNMLAMPFANGFSIAAENRGQHTIENVGIDISVEKSTSQTHQDIISRPRLRGVFQTAQDDGKKIDDPQQIFSRRGRGRWVGLVCQVPKDEPLAAKLNLIVDGQPLQAWADITLAEFLGRGGIDFRQCLSGRRNGLAWRYMLLAPVDFKQFVQLNTTTDEVGDRLALFYIYK